MNAREPRLELISRLPAGKARTPVLFVHGAYTGAWCWAEHFLDWFAAAGHPAHAVSLSGHGGSRGRRVLDSFSIDDYVRDVAEVADTFTTAPVLVGHSMGGFVVQKFLERRDAPAAVLMCSVPPQGLMGSAVNLMFNKPSLMGELNRLLAGAGASARALREALFAQPVDEDDLQRYYRLSQSESQRAIWDMSLFNLPDTRRVKRTPLLVLGAQHDHLIPSSLVDMTAHAYDVEPRILAGMGHGLMLERDWQDGAALIDTWLKENGL